ncbi:MAG: hypothetical protein CMM42_10000 [Rhodospirillaceae bacterium]|jgi:hypothetical protein|nr:hypothetical protein [Rhodospirillaceae bacterium]
MTNITIMMNDGSTELPRPWNRASSQDELLEMVAHFIGYHTGKSEQQAADMIDTSRIDLDAPIARVNLQGGKIIRFYAFKENY